MKQGDIVYVSGEAKDLWIEEYNVWVETTAVVVETPKKTAKKVLLTLDEIDGDRKVCCSVRKSLVQPQENIKYIDGIRILRLYDGCWYALFNDFRTYKTSKMECYSIPSFHTWCEKHSVIPVDK